jgi:hypothetical protein
MIILSALVLLLIADMFLNSNLCSIIISISIKLDTSTEVNLFLKDIKAKIKFDFANYRYKFIK